MANLADVRFHKDPTGRMWVAVVTSAMQHTDGFRGCNWQLYSPEGKIVGYGMSRGWDKEGAGSALIAHDYARKAAKRRWKIKLPKFKAPTDAIDAAVKEVERRDNSPRAIFKS